MGMIVEYNGVELWSPSLRVGAMFLAQVKSIEEALNRDSGFKMLMDDTIEVDRVMLASFIEEALTTLEKTNNSPLFAMMSGCLQVVIALNARITGEWPLVSGRLQPLVDASRRVMNPLPTSGHGNVHE